MDRKRMGRRRMDRRRMGDLNKEIGVQFSLMGRIVTSRMMWAGHLVRMEAGQLP